MFIIFIIIFSCIVIGSVISSTTTRKKKSPIVEKSHAWHEPEGVYSEPHADRVDNHLVKHPEPEPGYVVLNGIKRRIEDCKNL